MVEITLKDNSDLVKKATQEALEAALEAVGLQAETYAKNNITAAIPRGSSWYTSTGLLRDSITHDSDGTGMVVGTNVEYAIYNEMGTGIGADSGGRQGGWWYPGPDGKMHFTLGISAVHFLRDAVQDHADEYIQMITEELQARMS